MVVLIEVGQTMYCGPKSLTLVATTLSHLLFFSVCLKKSATTMPMQLDFEHKLLKNILKFKFVQKQPVKAKNDQYMDNSSTAGTNLTRYKHIL